MVRHGTDTKCVKRALLLAALALVSCTADETPRPTASPSGPPSIQLDAVEAHADQFEEELPNREAGSQQEFAAATYITAHLQQAGYVVEFDSVPVADAVRSTNVVALPPSTEDPEYLVVVAYDRAGSPASIGAFLEIARALRVSVPGHSVEFVAVGAQDTAEGAAQLGARRLIKLLQDRELTPHVVEIMGLDDDPGVVFAAGDAESDIADDFPPPSPEESLYEAAGFDYTWVSGGGPSAARAVFEFLEEKAR